VLRGSSHLPYPLASRRRIVDYTACSVSCMYRSQAISALWSAWRKSGTS
jgi:hypothetical protein